MPCTCRPAMDWRILGQKTIGQGGCTIRRGGCTIRGKAVPESRTSISASPCINQRHTSHPPLLHLVYSFYMSWSASGARTPCQCCHAHHVSTQRMPTEQMQTPKSHLSQPASKAGRAKLIQVGACRALQADGAWAHDVCAAPARQTRTGATFVVLSVGAVDTRRLAH